MICLIRSMRVGLIGEKLGHSFSKEIHEQLANYQYELIELSQEEFHSFMKARAFDAINVTIPYKEMVIPYLDEIDQKAKSIGAVNAIKNINGRLMGTNTDYDGLKLMIEHHFNLENEIVLICGSGATSKTAMAVVKDMNPKEIIQVSRTPNNQMVSYAQLKNRKDITYIIDTTSVGMSPNILHSVVDLKEFPNLKGVLDVVYNPVCTKICYDAKELGIKAVTGLEMLVGQAVVAIGFFLNKPMDISVIQKMTQEIIHTKQNRLYFKSREGMEFYEINEPSQIHFASLLNGKNILINYNINKNDLMALLLNGVIVK